MNPVQRRYIATRLPLTSFRRPDETPMNPFLETKRLSSGFSLVELMVAVVIGLIGTLVMFQVYATAEGQKRTTVSGGDATQNGAIALFSIERDVRNAGHAIDDLIPRGQPLYTWSNVNGVLPRTLFRPILITPGADSDSIEVNYSTNGGLTVPNAISGNWGSGVSPIPNLTVISVSGLANGDHIAICPNPIADPNSVCLQAEVTAVAPGGVISVAAPPTNYINQNNVAQTAEDNPAAGFGAVLGASVAADGLVLPVTFVGDGTLDNAVLFNLGDLVTRIYSVQNNQLRLTDAGVPSNFADGIIAIRAQYGLDTNNDRSVDVWVNPRGAAINPLASFTPDHLSFLIGSNQQIATSWRMVLAARVAIVTRNSNLEKTVVESRSSIPLWTNPIGNATPGPSFTVPTGDGNRYRYQVFETIVPLRNMIW